ncbi:acid phosphatase [Bordetella genomosp. 5]|uniref:phosphatase PAP2 family protein n=1 Tax=Bordetella genomosp. 5 TaxID=1395608 RepID=UPI000B9EA787|nr:phosphatase PAP2 family protein [Bordetella genomosp. 5]OZI46160.1 acid phosphatase [Bordetella genomosp. 5]
MNLIPPLPTPPLAEPPRMPAWRGGLTVCVVLAAMAASAHWIDQDFTLWIHAHVSPAVNDTFEWIGELGDPDVYLAAALAAYVLSLMGLQRGWNCPVRFGFDRIARVCVLLMATMATGGIVTWLLKRIVARARPEELLDDKFYGRGDLFAGEPFDSFPSSHTQAAFAVAAVVAIVAPRWRWPVFAVASLVAASRVVNRDHYLSDVVGGAMIAIVCAALLAPRVLSARYQWPLRAPWRWRRG